MENDAAVVVWFLYLLARLGIARSARRARWLARLARRLFKADPMPDLAEPVGLAAEANPFAVRVAP